MELISSTNPLIKLKAIKRLSFIIFSSNKDHFVSNYQELLPPIMSGLRDAVHTDLVIEYFTLLRVMLLRFSMLNDSSKEVAKNLQVLWPHILFKLQRICDEFNEPDMIQEGFKLLGTLEHLSIEDSKLIQWAFVLDCSFLITIAFGVNVLQKQVENIDYEILEGGHQKFIPLMLKPIAAKLSFNFMAEEKFSKESTNPSKNGKFTTL